MLEPSLFRAFQRSIDNVDDSALDEYCPEVDEDSGLVVLNDRLVDFLDDEGVLVVDGADDAGGLDLRVPLLEELHI